jgi:hypothetical protein
MTGLFDVLCESCVALALVIHRLYPERPHLRFRVCAAASVAQVANIVIETPFVCWIFFHKAMWSKWQLDFKISTPIAQVIFIAAQAWTAKGLFQMALRYRREAMEKSAVAAGIDSSASSLENNMHTITRERK